MRGQFNRFRSESRATKEYLEKDQWGNKREVENYQLTEEERAEAMFLKRVIRNLWEVRGDRFRNVSIDTGPLRMEELIAVIEYFKRNKAAGPSNIILMRTVIRSITQPTKQLVDGGFHSG